MPEERLNEIFSENLKRLLHEKNMSRSDLARAIDVGPSCISDWCNGRVVPRTDKMKLLVKFFNCKLSDLISDHSEVQKEKEEYEEFMEMLRTRPECKILFSTMKDATKEDIEQAAKVIEALRK